MNALRDMILADPGASLAIGGFVIGTLFGYIVLRTNFCTMGAISDVMSFGDYRRMRAWVLAATVSLAGAQLLDGLGVAPLAKSMYLTPSLNWLGNIVGGLLFGFGMVFAGGCASRNLVRVGAGDLRSLLTLIVMAVFAYMAIGGILGPLRNRLEIATSLGLGGLGLSTQGLGEMVGAAARLGPQTGTLLATAIVVAAGLLYCFKDASFRSSPVHIAAGVGVGLCVVAGWLLTGLAFDELADRPTVPLSLSYVRPTADALEWLQRFTAGMVPGFGVTTVLGAVFGAFVAARTTGRFKVATFTDVADTKRGLFGAALMGIGGVMALGCTIGQGITGVSTLALGSFLTSAAILAGGVQGMKTLERLLMRDG